MRNAPKITFFRQRNLCVLCENLFFLETNQWFVSRRGLSLLWSFALCVPWKWWGRPAAHVTGWPVGGGVGGTRELHSHPVFDSPDVSEPINLRSLTESILFALTCLTELRVNRTVRCCQTETFKQVELHDQEMF